MGNPACNIMLSAAGRRVALMRLLERSMAELSMGGVVFATDLTLMTPAMQLAAERVLVPPYRDSNCLSFLLNLCQQQSVRLIIPTIDPELTFYARHASEFLNVGCHINICSQEAIDIAFDKERTNAWLVASGFPTVRQTSLRQFLQDQSGFTLPVMVKPRRGSSSVGVTVASTMRSLEARSDERDLLVQSLAPGSEYTVDVFVDRTNRCRCAVPRLRMETRSGEVSKGMTVRHARVAQLARAVAETLPSAYGVLNIQIFADAQSGELAVIEINPRFGGGYPLSHEAGAPMTQWLLEDVMGLPSTANDEAWRDGLVMLRYDDAVFVDRSRLEMDS